MMRGWILFCLLALVLCSCSHAGEPEQVDLVSAVGIDGAGEKILLTLEVPTVGKTENGEGETRLLSADGTLPSDCLQALSKGLSRTLCFDHCALILLGDGLNDSQRKDALDFILQSNFLPLAAEAVSTQNAKALLSSGKSASPAVGYDLPKILFFEQDQTARARLYEMETGNGFLTLPRFESAPGDSGLRVIYTGVCTLKVGGDS